jgi:HK97 gp10 family phage protein
MTAKVTRKGKGLADIVKRMEDRAITVGVHDDTGSYPDGESVAQVAAWNEYGTEDIPERPFLRSTMAKRRKKYTIIMGTIAAAAVEGKASIKAGMARLGELVRSDVRNAIVNWSEPGNSPATIRKKGRDDPLVDTRRMLTSVEYKHAD